MQPPTVSRWRLLPLAVLSALAAAALSGSCTSFADESEGPGAVLTAALLAGGVALTISVAFLLLAPNLRRAKLLAAVCVTAYLAAGFGAWFFFIGPLFVALLITVAGGLLTYNITRTEPDSRAGYAAATTIIATLAIGISATAVVIGFFMNYDPNLGWFDGSGGSSSLNILPFALICGSAPPIAAVIAARLTGRAGTSGLAPPEQYPPAFPAHSQPSIAALAILVAVVGLCAAGADYLLWASHFGMLAGSHALGILAGLHALTSGLLPGCFALAVAALFVMVTPDRRETWLLAVISVFAYVAGVVGAVPYLPDPWQFVAGLAVVIIGGKVAANTAHRKFDSGGGTPRIAGVVSALGIFLAAACVASQSYGWMPFRSAPLFLGAMPVIIAAVAAHLAGRLCRK